MLWTSDAMQDFLDLVVRLGPRCLLVVSAALVLIWLGPVLTRVLRCAVMRVLGRLTARSVMQRRTAGAALQVLTASVGLAGGISVLRGMVARLGGAGMGERLTDLTGPWWLAPLVVLALGAACAGIQVRRQQGGEAEAWLRAVHQRCARCGREPSRRTTPHAWPTRAGVTRPTPSHRRHPARLAPTQRARPGLPGGRTVGDAAGGIALPRVGQAGRVGPGDVGRPARTLLGGTGDAGRAKRAGGEAVVRDGIVHQGRREPRPCVLHGWHLPQTDREGGA